MKVVALVSGGKDSCFAMMRCVDYGHEIVALANLMPLDDSIDELDSYMYQTVGHQIVVGYAECMGLPLFRRRIRGSTKNQELSYKLTPGDEVEDMFILLKDVKRQIPSISAVSSGAIASDYQRLRVESVCARLGLVSLAYLWKQDQTLLLEEMIQKGIKAITIKVAAMGLNHTKHLGKELSELQAHLLRMKELYGINVCGEGGEYETLTLDCPLFVNARIVLDKFQVILHSPDSIAPVGILHPLAFHLDHKTKVQLLTSSPRIYEVQEDNLHGCMLKCHQPTGLASDLGMTRKANLCISTSKRDMFSVGCWIKCSLKTLEDLQEDLTAALGRIESQLSKDGLDWASVLYIHMYISDMTHFALTNEVYVKFITQSKCHLGVPSRSTIELPLTQAGRGNAYIEVLVASGQCKRVLHVQSVSCWAPSCIGPYSQATLHKEVLFMAGQLGLDPPTMTLRSGGAAVEMEQALKNCEAVANCFNTSVSTSTIILVIYCSASLTAREKTEIENMIDHSLKQQKASNLHKENPLESSDPIFLYILASSLPKGALVEIKPVLLVPENEVDEVYSAVPPKPCGEIPSYWGFEYSKWRDCCCQIYSFRDRICTALVSITKQTATSVCSKSDPSVTDVLCYGCEMHVESIAKFCIYLVHGILSENHFSWDDLRHCRVYFVSDLTGTADVLSAAFSDACKQFRRSTEGIEMGCDEPIFSLVPVLGTGESTSMDDMITCEIFAMKS